MVYKRIVCMCHICIYMNIFKMLLIGLVILLLLKKVIVDRFNCEQN